MAVPQFQAFLLPLLRLVGSRESVTPQAANEALEAEFALSDEDRRQRLPSGQMTVFVNRVGWARTYLKKAGLLQTPRRGVWQITPKGREVLASEPATIDVRYLKQFPDFMAFHTSPDATPTLQPAETTVEQSESTPAEILESAFNLLQGSLASDLRDRLKDCSPEFFERLVVDVLVRMGYGGLREDAGQAVGGTGDGGIDGIIKEDRLGLDTIYVQAKRWEGTVSRPEIQKFAGALQGQRATKGVFITTSSFTKEAEDYVQRINMRIILIDGGTLARLMIEHDVGVATTEVFKVKRIDSDYFNEE